MSVPIKKSPQLSVVIPAYEAVGSIEDAVRSARGAGATQIIVVDDGSSDGTYDAAVALGVECFRQENSGAAVARLNGSRRATGEFVVFLDADDELIADGVAESIRLLQADPGLSVAAGTLLERGANGTLRESSIRYSPITTASLLQVGYGPWPPGAQVVRFSSLRRTEAMEPTPLLPRYADDYELLIRLSIVGAVNVRRQPCLVYSMAGGKSAIGAERALDAKEAIRAYYSIHTGVDVQLMTTREKQTSAYAREARAHLASGLSFSAIGALFRWAWSKLASVSDTLRARGAAEKRN